ncbi:MAG: hypothetical protein CMG66_05255 [Candidatus Marinimicrobia bacterium]|nr:hypothetical protein [Candidatus Neomarinimicrobiota bacterium]|tara:strand:+ start:71345 stop:72253 length:909 start_codon:yes stop_codon:yes gene_type:complete
MIIRKNIFNNFKWLKKTKQSFIISADYDGLICAAFLSHHLDWNLAGYYNMEKIWISEEGLQKKNDLIWVDLDIVPKSGKTLGGHIVILDQQMPSGLKSSCNPNIIQNISGDNFKSKYPLSTLSFLLWLFQVSIPKTQMAQFLVLHSDSTWLKYQQYTKNFRDWLSLLDDYEWTQLFKNINTVEFEKKVDQEFYPLMIQIGAISGFSKLKSKHLHIKSRDYQFNPDWDEDIILDLFDVFAQNLLWSPPKMPQIIRKINGKRQSIPVADVVKIGLNQFIKKNKVFSYSITSPKKMKYTVFNQIK